MSFSLPLACLLAYFVREFAFWSLARCVYTCTLLRDIAARRVGAGGSRGPGSLVCAFLNVVRVVSGAYRWADAFVRYFLRS